MPGVAAPPPSRPSPLTLVNAAVAADLFEVDARWEMGYEFAPDACNGSGKFDPVCGSAFDYSPEDRPSVRSVQPFGVVAGDRCSTFGFRAEDYEERARRLLDMSQSYEIADELWSGTIATAAAGDEYDGNQYLTNPASDTVTEGETAPIAALACLEDALASCGRNRRGMIHATPQLVTHWMALGNSVLRREGGMLLTVHDTIIVTDGGYDGSGPGGTPAGESQWAYATGLISVRVGQVVVPMTFAEAVDRSVNTVELYAWRPATYAWDGCCHFAAEVNLSRCLVGGAS